MDELAQVRSELARLEKEEHDLHEQLSRVRVAIEVHKSRVEDLVRTKPAPIGSLPPEIILYVLELADFPFLDYRIRELARVSRAWRDIILSFPMFWSNISSLTNLSFLRTRVARSRQYPLTITIEAWRTPAELSSFLDVIVPHAYRWRTLDIHTDGHECIQVILDKINHLKFPSLLHTTIIADENMQYPVFLRPENAPSLKSLELSPLIPMDDFPPGQMIANLLLQFSRGHFGPMVLPSLLSSQNLTTLNFACSDYPSLQPDSISLPLLTSLTLEVAHPRGLILAFVAPQLLYLHFTAVLPTDWTSTVFHGSESKFRHVQHLVLQAPSSVLGVEDTDVVFSVFPNLHHVEMCTMDMPDLFRTNVGDLRPADHWESLKSLTFCDMVIYCESSIIDDLIEWLDQRKLAGRPMLNVVLTGCQFLFDHVYEDLSEDVPDPGPLLALYDLLGGTCLLDIPGISLRTLVDLSLSSSSLSQLVCIVVIVKPVTLLTSMKGLPELSPFLPNCGSQLVIDNGTLHL